MYNIKKYWENKFKQKNIFSYASDLHLDVILTM